MERLGPSVRRSTPARLIVLVAVLAVGLMPGSSVGTVAEQRARLPPPATCEDAVQGIWRAHYHDPRRRAWRIFTLEMRWVDGGDQALEGSITNHGWNGGPEREQPGPCEPGLTRWQVKMDARGKFTDGTVHFAGTRWWLDKQYCGNPWWARQGAYNLDTFAGKIDPERQEFQSISNDGGAIVNVPMVFRRISCFDQPAPPPAVSVQPPPLFTGRRSSGCCG